MSHTFHIPVLGLAFSVDTPLKVAKFGITSVMSIVDDELIERVRLFHEERTGRLRPAIPAKAPDSRAHRITAYLDLVADLLDEQLAAMKAERFEANGDLCRYFEYLPEAAPAKTLFLEMQASSCPAERERLQQQLKDMLEMGRADVNIMSKVDKMNLKQREDREKHSDALLALRGFAQSRLKGSLILSAGMNPRLYNYLADFDVFLPDERGTFRKEVVLKVSDFRSAYIQAKFLAKKGIWVSEFRVESGLNCGGHAFATNGLLLGPILEEFKGRRKHLQNEMREIYGNVLMASGRPLPENLAFRLTAQGGVGTAAEHRFLLDYYQLDAVGWGSPFLLVPEATNVDEETLNRLQQAEPQDFYVSGASPLGVPFNNFRGSTAEAQRLHRIECDRPGSPCTKKYLVSNTEFTREPICTASLTYQRHKLNALKRAGLSADDYERQRSAVLEKTCLCAGLSSSFYLKHRLIRPRENQAVAICPGPNLRWFKGIFSLEQMIDHIYGRTSLMDKRLKRPNLFLNELELYKEHLRAYWKTVAEGDIGAQKFADNFNRQLLMGIAYYRQFADHALFKANS